MPQGKNQPEVMLSNHVIKTCALQIDFWSERCGSVQVLNKNSCLLDHLHWNCSSLNKSNNSWKLFPEVAVLFRGIFMMLLSFVLS